MEDFKRHVVVWHSVFVNAKLDYACKFLKQCSTCLLYTNASHLTAHVARYHPNKEAFKCPHPTCGNSYYVLSHLRAHKKMHAKDTVVCDCCGVSFLNIGRLRCHMKVHYTGVDKNLSLPKRMSYICGLCGARFGSGVALQWHIAKSLCLISKSHQQPDVPSTICGLEYSGKVGFLGHKRLTLKNSRAKLDNSGSLCRRVGRPKKADSKRKDVFACCECGQKFGTTAKLKKHRCQLHRVKHENATNEDLVDVRCRICHKRFSSMEDFMQHTLVSHNIVKFSEEFKSTACPTCGLVFNNTMGMKMHAASCKIRINEITPIYVCRVCGMGFDMKASLQMHESRSHSSNNE
jgi:rubredoxin